MAKTIVLARANGARIPRVKEKPVASGSVFLCGAALVVNGSGEYAECGADPAAIAAFAESDFGPSTEIGAVGGRSEFPWGKMQGTAVQDETQFRGPYTGTLPAAMGGSYGLTRGSDLIWRVDFSKTSTSARVKVLQSLAGSPENVPEVIFVVLAANVQVI